MPYTFGIVDLFAGPGGLGEGFSAFRDRSGSYPFSIEVSIEKDSAAHAISTEHQLDTAGLDTLFLYVSEVTDTSEDDPNGVTVADVARDVLEKIQVRDTSVVELFEERLLATGFDWADDYSDRKWLVGPDNVFEVTEGFPRITPQMYPTGATNVRYSISLQDCEPFRTDHPGMILRLTGGQDGDQR